MSAQYGPKYLDYTVTAVVNHMSFNYQFTTIIIIYNHFTIIIEVIIISLENIVFLKYYFSIVKYNCENIIRTCHYILYLVEYTYLINTVHFILPIINQNVKNSTSYVTV